MAFTSTLELNGAFAHITLVGELDASAAPQFRVSIEGAAAANVKRLVLFMSDLSYMASAGLRSLVYAKQKMGSGVDIYMVGVQETVVETIEMTGFHNSVIIVPTYDVAAQESGGA
ncbi:MAG: anti-sigma factor antagonist [Chloroflexales bacterium]